MNESTTSTFLELPASWQELFSDNDIDLAKYLTDLGIPATSTFSVLPDADPSNRSKDLTMLILASGASALAIGFAVSQILSTVFHRPHKVEYFEFVEAQDTQGNPVLDEDGKTILKRVLRHQILETSPAKQKSAAEINFNITKGLVIKFSSSKEPAAQLSAPLRK